MEVFRGMGNYALHDIVLEDDASSRLATVLLIEGEAAPEPENRLSARISFCLLSRNSFRVSASPSPPLTGGGGTLTSGS
jgi:hypothetical protein